MSCCDRGGSSSSRCNANAGGYAFANAHYQPNMAMLTLYQLVTSSSAGSLSAGLGNLPSILRGLSARTN